MRRLNLLAALLLALLLVLAVPLAGARGKPPGLPGGPPPGVPGPPPGIPGPPPGVPGPPVADFWLTVLHNNDGESRLIAAGTDPVLSQYGGVARFKTIVDRLKREATTGPQAAKLRGKSGVVMISSGDNFLAGPQFNASLEKGPPFYDSIAMNLLGYDAAAIGNHEFDFGPDILADFIEGTTGFPWLSANIDVSAEPRLQTLWDAGRIAPSTVLKVRGERIGVIGAVTPLLPAISSPRNVVVDPNVAGVVQAEVDRLTAAGVDKIILSSHLQSVGQDLALIPLLRNVDIAIAGGGDELLASPGTPVVPGDTIQGPYPLNVTDADGKTVPVVTTAGDYKYVGRLVVGFDRNGNVVAVDESSDPVRVSGNPADPDFVEPDPVMQALVVDPVAEHVEELVSTVVGISQVALEGRRGANPPAATPGVRRTETNLGNLLADALRWQANRLAAGFGVEEADVALQNGGGIRNESLIPAGPITAFDTFAIAAFSNFVSIAPNIPSSQFKEILENGVSRYPTADGRFGQWSGITFSYSASGQAQVVDNDGNVLVPGLRVQEAVLDDGTVVVTGGLPVFGVSVNVATNDFTARGGDQYPFRGAPFTTLGVTYQQALSNYISNPQGLNGLITAADYPEGGEGRIVVLP
jgi:2',3'-cyclic-nucleotide 2'-phosphodiesterase (5'-nucleotidase family)